MNKKTVCKFCIAQKGLSGKELHEDNCDYAFDDEKEFLKHLKDEHNITVTNDDGKAIN